MLPPLTFVIGGAASGKSAWAEAQILAQGGPRAYIATAQAWDEEMRAKIAAHRAARGQGWLDLEAPLDLAAALRVPPAGSAILIDCATMWLTNLMLAEADIAAAQEALFAALKTAPGPVVIVSNELGQGIVPENAMAREFRNLQGRFNQALATRADRVVTVIAGLPLALKGTL